MAEIITVKANVNAPVEKVWKLWSEPGTYQKVEQRFGRLAHAACGKRSAKGRKISEPNGGERWKFRL